MSAPEGWVSPVETTDEWSVFLPNGEQATITSDEETCQWTQDLQAALAAAQKVRIALENSGAPEGLKIDIVHRTRSVSLGWAEAVDTILTKARIPQATAPVQGADEATTDEVGDEL